MNIVIRDLQGRALSVRSCGKTVLLGIGHRVSGAGITLVRKWHYVSWDRPLMLIQRQDRTD